MSDLEWRPGGARPNGSKLRDAPAIEAAVAELYGDQRYADVGMAPSRPAGGYIRQIGTRNCQCARHYIQDVTQRSC